MTRRYRQPIGSSGPIGVRGVRGVRGAIVGPESVITMRAEFFEPEPPLGIDVGPGSVEVASTPIAIVGAIAADAGAIELAGPGALAIGVLALDAGAVALERCHS